MSALRSYYISGSKGLIKVWTLGTLKESFKAHQNIPYIPSDQWAWWANSVAFSVDGSEFNLRQVERYDANATEYSPPKQVLSGHTGSVKSVAYHPDISKARWIVSGSSDKTVRLWDLKEGRAEMVWERTEAVDSVDYGGVDHILSSGTKMALYDRFQGKIFQHNGYGVTRCLSVALSPGPGLNATDKPWCGRFIASGEKFGFHGSEPEAEAFHFVSGVRRRGFHHRSLAAFSAGGTNRAVDLMDLCTIFLLCWPVMSPVSM